MNNSMSNESMSRTPGWVWKQRNVVMRFMVAFYIRRMLQCIRNSVPFLAHGRRRVVSIQPLPTRRRPPANNAKPVDYAQPQ